MTKAKGFSETNTDLSFFFAFLFFSFLFLLFLFQSSEERFIISISLYRMKQRELVFSGVITMFLNKNNYNQPSLNLFLFLYIKLMHFN